MTTTTPTPWDRTRWDRVQACCLVAGIVAASWAPMVVVGFVLGIVRIA